MADALNNNILILTDAVNKLTSQVSVLTGGGRGQAAPDSLSERAFFLGNIFSSFKPEVGKLGALVKKNNRSLQAFTVIVGHTFARWSSLQTKAATLSTNTNMVQHKLFRSNYENRITNLGTQTELMRLAKGLGRSEKFTAELSDKLLSLGGNMGGLMAANADLNTRYMLTGRQTEHLAHTMLLGASEYNRSSDDMVRALNDLGQEFANVAGVMGFGVAADTAQQQLVAMFGDKGTPFINNLLRMLGSSDTGQFAKIQALGLGKLQQSLLNNTITAEEIITAIRENKDVLGAIGKNGQSSLLRLGALDRFTGGGFTMMKQLNHLFEEPVKKWTNKTGTDKSWQQTIRYQLERFTDPLLYIMNSMGPGILNLLSLSMVALQGIALAMMFRGAGRMASFMGMGAGLKIATLNAAVAATTQAGMNTAALSTTLKSQLALGQGGKVAAAAAGGGGIARALTGGRLMSAVAPALLMAGRFIPYVGVALIAGMAAKAVWNRVYGSTDDKKADQIELRCPELSHLATTNRELINARVSLMNRDIFTGVSSSEVYSKDSLTELRGIAASNAQILVNQLSSQTNLSKATLGKTP